MNYYFCHHGHYEFAEVLAKTIKQKRFKEFMEIYFLNPWNFSLSEYAVDYDGNAYPVWIKENFDAIDTVDYEHG